VGISLIILSWFPFAQIFLFIAHNNGKLTSNQSSQYFRLLIWAIQIVIGFVGLWLAGKIAIAEAKKDGWKHTPKSLWHLFWTAA
jgi:hypothetical protein